MPDTDPILTYLRALLTDHPLPPPTGDEWQGAASGSPEWTELLAADPFIPFPIHPLPPALAAFIAEHPDLDARERNAICELLETIHQLPPRGFCVIEERGQYSVFRDVEA